MRRWITMIGSVVAMALPIATTSGPAWGRDYRSGFGVGISVPESYLVLSRDELERNADFFIEGDSQDSPEAVPLSLRRDLFESVRSGQLEILYRTDDVDPDFVDNVNIVQKRVDLPSDESELNRICQLLPVEFSRLFGRPIGMDGCEMRFVGARPALYLAFDGAMPGTKTLQYQIRKAPGQTLIMTATAAASNLTRMLGEFEKMVTSMRMP
jgi:hypothetical protein